MYRSSFDLQSDVAGLQSEACAGKARGLPGGASRSVCACFCLRIVGMCACVIVRMRVFVMLDSQVCASSLRA